MKQLSVHRQKYIHYLILILLCLGIAFIHLFRLNSVPYGINVDEIGMGYDAYCLANFGTDRYLNSYPLYAINYASGQSVLMGYICAFFVKLMGLSIWSMRLPSAVSAFVTAYYGAKLVQIKYSDSQLHIDSFLFLFMVCPVFQFLFRIGLDCNIMLATFTMFLYYLCFAVDTQKIKYFITAGIIGGLVLYSYVLSHLMLPIFLLLLLMYVIRLKKISLRQFIACFIPLVILGIPLVLFQMIQIFDLDSIQLGIFTLPKMYYYRGSEITLTMFGENFKNIWKTIFLYDNLLFDSVPQFGNLYYVSLPLLLIGFCRNTYIAFISIKNKKWNISVPSMIWFWTVIIIGCFNNEAELEEGLRLYRYNAIYIIVLLFLLDGIDLCYKFIKRKKKTIAYGFIGILTGVYIFSFTSFLQYYFGEYSQIDDITYFNHPFDNALQYLEDMGVSDQKTYIGKLNQTYIYYLYSAEVTPQEFYRGELKDSPALWEWANSFKNYEFNLPDTPVLNANYIVGPKENDYADMLKELGFKESIQGHYRVFTSPMADFDTAEMSKNSYGWDSGINGQTFDATTNGSDIDGIESYVIVGWSYDVESGSLWDDIYIQINGTSYYSEPIERTDIVDATNNSDIATCGFVFILPAEQVRQADTIKLCGVNMKHSYIREVPVNVSK